MDVLPSEPSLAVQSTCSVFSCRHHDHECAAFSAPAGLFSLPVAAVSAMAVYVMLLQSEPRLNRSFHLFYFQL